MSLLARGLLLSNYYIMSYMYTCTCVGSFDQCVHLQFECAGVGVRMCSAIIVFNIGNKRFVLVMYLFMLQDMGSKSSAAAGIQHLGIDSCVLYRWYLCCMTFSLIMMPSFPGCPLHTLAKGSREEGEESLVNIMMEATLLSASYTYKRRVVASTQPLPSCDNFYQTLPVASFLPHIFSSACVQDRA